MPKIAIVSGEPSGDLIASELMRDLVKINKNISFVGIGGPEMKKLGLNSFFDYSILSVMGVIDVLKNIRTLFISRKKLVSYLLKEKPDLFIGVDAPDFNFYIERKMKDNGIRTFHLISPSVWAWRKNRIYYMKKVMHHLFCAFPHEPEIFKKVRLPTTYVGHSLASRIPFKPNIVSARNKLKITSKNIVISILPGSRRHEVEKLSEIFLRTAELIAEKKQCLFLISASSKENYLKIKRFIKNYRIENIRIVIGHSHDVISAADLVILASGTATLETALFKKPMVVAYKSSWIEFAIYKMVRLIKFISLPNILLNREVVPEFLQDNLSPEILSQKVFEILDDKKYQSNLKKDFNSLHKLLKRNTSQLIFDQIKKYL